MLSIQGVANLLHAYAIRGMDFEILMDLARGRPMSGIADRWGLKEHEMRTLRNSMFSHYPILQKEISARTKRVPCKENVRKILLRDRELLRLALQRLIADKKVPIWSRELVASLGLEMLDYIDIPGSTEQDMVNGLYSIYGLPAWISHKRCKICKLMLGTEEHYAENSRWRLVAEICRGCESSIRRKQRLSRPSPNPGSSSRNYAPPAAGKLGQS